MPYLSSILIGAFSKGIVSCVCVCVGRVFRGIKGRSEKETWDFDSDAEGTWQKTEPVLQICSDNCINIINNDT